MWSAIFRIFFLRWYTIWWRHNSVISHRRKRSWIMDFTFFVLITIQTSDQGYLSPFSRKKNQNRFSPKICFFREFWKIILFEVGINATLLLVRVEIHFVEFVNHTLQIFTFYLFRVWLLTVPFWTMNLALRLIRQRYVFHKGVNFCRIFTNYAHFGKFVIWFWNK